jgi:hypothetical protein
MSGAEQHGDAPLSDIVQPLGELVWCLNRALGIDGVLAEDRGRIG